MKYGVKKAVIECYQLPVFASVIIHLPGIYHRPVKLQEITDASRVTPADGVFRDVMAA
jgi:hypothetical protein